MKTLLKVFLIVGLSIIFISSCSANGFFGKSKRISNNLQGNDVTSDDDDDDDSLYDPDGDGEISEDEFNKGSGSDGGSSQGGGGSGSEDKQSGDLFGPMSAQIHRVESDCLSGKCDATITLKLAKIGKKKLSSKITDNSVQIHFSSKGATVTGSTKICPTKKVTAKYEMSISYGGDSVDPKDRSILIGARDPNNKGKMYIGLADTLESNYAFHNIDSVIGSVSCSDVKQIVIRYLCRDQVLEGDPTLLKCWMIQGQNSSCPEKNVYSSGSYSASCKEDKW